ncbi:hypothetical protein H4R33_000863 [Dimargaris cristalligena]|uniref:RNA polymerase II-associated n=1 Tax=Dimargaris cristalligena TaxID=215637 RepID=A0A4P9ZX48_9FUNG|nr:hypothetical protein H4R33_000863 [Dimargaris cristalligena]RKP38213.1 RNA polymerase II-associated [Dimargaris cristalligena]|eukprot:RKP38213.1 RNA polymerase II-associated [Dimargaris cristalligena]
MPPKRKPGVEFLCKTRYLNPLPDLPFPPKLLAIDTSEYHAELTRYQTTTLAQQLPFPLYADSDLGMPLDLILLGAFDSKQSPTAYEVDPADRLLLTSPPPEGQNLRNRTAAVTWLRRTEYISAEITRSTSRTAQPSRSRAPISDRAAPAFDHSRGSQISSVQRSFDAVAAQEKDDLATWVHPSKPNVHAVASLPVLPNTEAWGQTYSYCIFDTFPTLGDSAEPTKQVEAALLRPVASSLVEQGHYISVYTPDAASSAILQKRRRLANPSALKDNEPLLFNHGRDFTCEKHVLDDLSQLQFSLTAGGEAIYTPVKSRLNLRKKRATRRPADILSGGYGDESDEEQAPAQLQVTLSTNPSDDR